VFCEGVQHRLRFCLDHVSCVKMAAFQFYFQSGKQRREEWARDDSHVVSAKIPWWKRKCETVCCHDATASNFVGKVRCEVFAHFHAVTVKCHSSMQNWLLGLPVRILYEQSPWCQIKLWATSWLYSWLVSPFSVSVSLDFSIGRIVAMSQGLNHKSSSFHLEQNLMLTCCSFVGSVAKFHQARYMTPNKRT
jgi:hypothetical protein